MNPLPVPVLEVGGSHVTSALVSSDLRSVRQAHRSSLLPDGGREDLLQAIAASARRIDAPRGAVWGIAVPGPFDYAAGVARYADVGKFDALNGVSLRAELSDRLDLPPEALRFMNDAEAFALGAYTAMHPHPRRAIFLTLGTGIGSGFVADGSAVRSGPDVPTSGELWTQTWHGAPIEDAMSTRALIAAYEHRTGATVDVKTLCVRARRGEAAALAVLEQALGALGEAVAPWAGRFKATAVVVGGSITRSWDVIGPPLTQSLHSAMGTDRLAVLPAAAADDTALIGVAVALTLEHATG
jgi:glucokinase